MNDLTDFRKEYKSEYLIENQMSDDPVDEFSAWMTLAIQHNIPEPNAMTLATVSENGKPSARVVLLKELTHDGCVFFTNYHSRKGRELAASGFAALVFDWHEMARQIRIEGSVEKISPEASDSYFASRPRTSQIGAWVSAQSTVIACRQTLDDLKSMYEARFKNQPIARPAHWGGYILRPTYFEFWQGNENRLHDRIAYTVSENGWTKYRLAP